MSSNRLTHMQKFLKPIVSGGHDGIVTIFAIVAVFPAPRQPARPNRAP